MKLGALLKVGQNTGIMHHVYQSTVRLGRAQTTTQRSARLGNIGLETALPQPRLRAPGVYACVHTLVHYHCNFRIMNSWLPLRRQTIQAILFLFNYLEAVLTKDSHRGQVHLVCDSDGAETWAVCSLVPKQCVTFTGSAAQAAEAAS